MLKAVSKHKKVLVLAHLHVLLVERSILGSHHCWGTKEICVTRSQDSHALTVHINQNAGSDCGTILQKCTNHSSWCACHSEEVYVEICYLVLCFPSTSFWVCYFIHHWTVEWLWKIQIDRDVEGSGCGLFKFIVPVLAWRCGWLQGGKCWAWIELGISWEGPGMLISVATIMLSDFNYCMYVMWVGAVWLLSMCSELFAALLFQHRLIFFNKCNTSILAQATQNERSETS